MQRVNLHCTVTGHSLRCPAQVAGADLLRTLGRQKLTLASITPLNGGVYRRYRFVQSDGLYDLTVYTEIYTPDRKLLARIEAA